MINETLFHGSKRAGLLTLNAAASQNTVFGPAIYCTADRSVAAAQSGANVIYKVRIEGPEEGIIEFDRPLLDASPRARAAIQTFLRRYKLMSILDTEDDRVDFLQERAAAELVRRGVEYPPKTLFNRIIAEEGVWLMRGEMHGLAKSGMVDRGIQWVVIDDRYLSILEQQPLYFERAG
ncbi:hypothetical protein [Marinobacter adhaerens]|uniref:hypothetical protein n=1 Tax=Marinobacter adhaerens TaxID=1033846 RepID=UPI001E41CE3A|nr:hypothetical protein [Marinobacter adhaerens]MCD1649694.1 hypothetical protein [Marinobacter adhaerens]